MRNGTTSPDAAASAPPAAGPTSAPIAQAAFIRPKAIPCGEPAPLGAFGDQREGRGEEDAVRARGEDDERDVGERPRRRALARLRQRRSQRARPERGARLPRRSSRRPAIGESAVSKAAPTSQTRADRSGPPAGGREVERRERRENAREQRRRAPSARARAEARVAQRPSHRGQGRSVRRNRARAASSTPQARRRGRRARVKTDATAERARPPRRARARTARRTRRRRVRVPISWPRRSRGAAARSQANAPAQVKPLAKPCRKRAIASGQKPWANANPRLAKAHQRQAGEDGATGAESRRCCSAGQPAHERAGRVGRDERSGARLREMERVREVGEERRERRVEHRVHPDERADENEEAPHCARSVRRPTVRM